MHGGRATAAAGGARWPRRAREVRVRGRLPGSTATWSETCERAGGIGLNVAVHVRRLCAPPDTCHARGARGRRCGRRARARGDRPCGREGVPRDRSGRDARAAHPPCARRRAHLPGAIEEGVLGGFRVSARQREAIAAQRRAGDDGVRPGAHVLRVRAGLPAHEACEPSTSRTPTTSAIPSCSPTRWAPELDVGLFGLQSSDTALIAALEAVARRSGRLFVITLGPGRLARARSRCPHRVPCPPRRSVSWTRRGRATPSRPASCASTPLGGTSKLEPRPRLPGGCRNAGPPRRLRAAVMHTSGSGTHVACLTPMCARTIGPVADRSSSLDGAGRRASAAQLAP